LKKGNSEVYVICIDFNRDNFANCFSDNLQINSIPYSLSFLNQLVQCSQLFQSCQIDTIQHNLNYFQNLTRKFSKKLHKLKDDTLDTFINQCQIRELLSTDRHLLKTNFELKRLYQNNDRITRTGTFNNQHQIDIDIIRTKIQNGFFCLICSNDNLCDTCQTLSRIIEDRSLSVNKIYIGQLIADKQTIIDCIFGKQSIDIRNSCFCNRYLLELCSKMDVNRVLVVR
jgi:hypothetical protein